MSKHCPHPGCKVRRLRIESQEKRILELARKVDAWRDSVLAHFGEYVEEHTNTEDPKSVIGDIVQGLTPRDELEDLEL